MTLNIVIRVKCGIRQRIGRLHIAQIVWQSNHSVWHPVDWWLLAQNHQTLTEMVISSIISVVPHANKYNHEAFGGGCCWCCIPRSLLFSMFIRATDHSIISRQIKFNAQYLELWIDWCTRTSHILILSAVWQKSCTYTTETLFVLSHHHQPRLSRRNAMATVLVKCIRTTTTTK